MKPGTVSEEELKNMGVCLQKTYKELRELIPDDFWREVVSEEELYTLLDPKLKDILFQGKMPAPEAYFWTLAEICAVSYVYNMARDDYIADLEATIAEMEAERN